MQSAPPEASTPAGPPDLQELLARLGWNGRQLGWWMLALIVLLVVAGPLLAGPLIAGGVFWLVWRAVQSAKQLNARD